MRAFRYLSPGASMVCDGARYLAAVLVALHHGLAYFYGAEYRSVSQSAVYTNLGTLGVAVFFVLSGFLITYTIRKKSRDAKYDYLTYGIERFIRIYLVFVPAFLLALAFNALNTLWIHDSVPGMEYLTWRHALATLCMLSGIEPLLGTRTYSPSLARPGPSTTSSSRT